MTDGTVLVAYVHPATQIEHSFATCLMSLANYDAAHDQRLFGSAGPLMMRAGTSGIVDARNKIMQHWLDQTSDTWLWSVDTDMGFLPDTVDALLDSADPETAPVVGALCFGLKQIEQDGYGGWITHPFPTIYGWDHGPDGHEGFRAVGSYERDSLIQVAGTGAACLLVHRTAAEKVRAEYGDDWFSPVRYPDGRFLSEDLSFCYRLGVLGLPVHVNTGVKTTHAKQIWVSEADWFAHQALTQAMHAAASSEEQEGTCSS